MSFQQSIRTALTKYADFSGRAGRAEFWWFFLFVVLGEAVCNVFAVIPVTNGASLGVILANLFALAVLLPFLAVGVRRLRDTGKDWRNIFWLLVPIAGIIVLAVYWYAPTAPQFEASETRG